MKKIRPWIRYHGRTSSSYVDFYIIIFSFKALWFVFSFFTQNGVRQPPKIKIKKGHRNGKLLLQSVMLMNSSLIHLIDHMLWFSSNATFMVTWIFLCIIKMKSSIIPHVEDTWCLKMSSCICIVFLMDSTLFLSSILSMGPCNLLIPVLWCLFWKCSQTSTPPTAKLFLSTKVARRFMEYSILVPMPDRKKNVCIFLAIKSHLVWCMVMPQVNN